VARLSARSSAILFAGFSVGLLVWGIVGIIILLIVQPNQLGSDESTNAPVSYYPPDTTYPVPPLSPRTYVVEIHDFTQGCFRFEEEHNGAIYELARKMAIEINKTPGATEAAMIYYIKTLVRDGWEIADLSENQVSFVWFAPNPRLYPKALLEREYAIFVEAPEPGRLEVTTGYLDLVE
jgi:hypothetical protein